MTELTSVPGSLVTGWRWGHWGSFEVDFYGDDGIEADLRASILHDLGDPPNRALALYRQVFRPWHYRDGSTQLFAQMLARRVVVANIPPCHPAIMIKRLIVENMVNPDNVTRADFGDWRIADVRIDHDDLTEADIDSCVMGGQWEMFSLLEAVVCCEGIDLCTTAVRIDPGVYEIVIGRLAPPPA